MAKKYTRDSIEYKLKEADFFLEKIFEAQGSMDTPYYFSAFLSAAKSVTTMLYKDHFNWAKKAEPDIPDLKKLQSYRNFVLKEGWRDYKVSPAYYLNPHTRSKEEMTNPQEPFLLKRQLFLVTDLEDSETSISILDHSEVLHKAAERLFYKAIEDGII